MTPRVTIVGLGPAGSDLVNQASLDAIATHGPARTIVRTHRHPAASLVAAAPGCDDLYDARDSFDEVYGAIVERVVAAALDHGEVCYVVPGSPLVLERTVERLRADGRIDTVIVPSMSFLDVAWARLGVDPVEARVTLVDGHAFATAAAGLAGPLLVAHCHNQRVLSDIKLATDEPADTPVVILQGLGLPGERIVHTTWCELDRAVEADHLTSVYVPSLREPVAAAFARFEQQIAHLRTRCPWDAEQTHQSLRRHLLEETYEVLEAIDRLEHDADEGYGMLEEELGDLLFQVFFHAVIATENGRFTASDVARGIHDKLRHRHPHVFGDVEVADADEVVANWEQIKKAEKGHASVMDGIPDALPAILYAQKVLKKAAAAALESEPELLIMETTPLPVDEASAGRTLLALVDGCRRAGIDAESALRAAAEQYRHAALAADERRA